MDPKMNFDAWWNEQLQNEEWDDPEDRRAAFWEVWRVLSAFDVPNHLIRWSLETVIRQIRDEYGE